MIVFKRAKRLVVPPKGFGMSAVILGPVGATPPGPVGASCAKTKATPTIKKIESDRSKVKKVFFIYGESNRIYLGAPRREKPGASRLVIV